MAEPTGAVGFGEAGPTGTVAKEVVVVVVAG